MNAIFVMSSDFGNTTVQMAESPEDTAGQEDRVNRPQKMMPLEELFAYVQIELPGVLSNEPHRKSQLQELLKELREDFGRIRAIVDPEERQREEMLWRERISDILKREKPSPPGDKNADQTDEGTEYVGADALFATGKVGGPRKANFRIPKFPREIDRDALE